MCLLGCLVIFTTAAQNKNKIPPAVTNIFNDLPVDDPAKNSILQPGEDSLKKIKENIFVTGTISKTRCFLGEPVLLTYTLFSALQSTSNINVAPSFAGFSITAMDTDNEQVKRRKQDGKTYWVFVIQKLQLYPLQEGPLTIEPVSIYNEVNYKENQQTFRYSGITNGKAITLNVEALPLAGRPAAFTGATGSFAIRAMADTNVPAGENNHLHIEISGTGSFAALAVPAIQWPAGCEHFSVETHLQINKNAFPPSGKKVFDIPFVATKEGILVIPGLSLNFFNTQDKAYHQAYSDSLVIHVAAPLHKAAVKPQQAVPAETSFPLYLLTGVFVLLMLLLAVFLYRKKRMNNTGHRQPVSSTPVVPRPVLSIEEALHSLQKIKNGAAYITAFKKAFTAYLQQQTGNAAVEPALQQLRQKDPALAALAEELYYQCNSLLYTPGELSTADRHDLENKFIRMGEKMNRIFM